MRAPLFHTRRNPFINGGALEAYSDGALFISEGRIIESGDYGTVRAHHPDASITDLRDGFVLPGFIDTHIHFPQLRVLGSLGKELLGWLDEFALPEEARMADLEYACQTAHRFVRGLMSHGTTTALVFGAHFAPAMAALFEAGLQSGLRIISGMALSDRHLRPDLHQTPENAYRDCSELIVRFHGHGRLLYAVTPRFAVSTSESMLEVCTSLMREHQGLRLQTHLNENRQEIEQVARLFSSATDYFAVYERFGLCGRGAVMAHNLHCSDSELERLAGTGTAVSHCPCSNAALGSGFFPLRRHIEAGVQCSLGTDVGGGTGFGILKEGLQAYLLQRLAPDGFALAAEHLLYLSTRGGAEALNLGDQIGDFSPGKWADFVYLRPPKNSPLAAVIERADSLQRILAAVFTLGDASCVKQVRVAGSAVYSADANDN